MSIPQIDVPVPARMRNLPRDHRQFIVPFFVAWFKDGEATRPGIGEPDFRVVDPKAFGQCVRFGKCWLCGQPLGKHCSFVLGPMCVVTHINSEPPSHRDCAEYAMRVCPFLTKPNMRRNTSSYDMQVIAPAGEHSDANPGIMALWVTDGAKMFAAEEGQPGMLFEVNEPSEVTWWREGRPATLDEVTFGIAKAMVPLETNAARQGAAAMHELERFAERTLRYLPK